MENLWNLPAVLCGWFGLIFGSLFGQTDQLLHAVIFLMVCDYVVGVIGAIINKQVSSRIGFNGFLRKLLMLITIAVAVELNRLMPTIAIRDFVLYFYIANEGISILENLCKFVPVPDKLKEVFQQIRK